MSRKHPHDPGPSVDYKLRLRGLIEESFMTGFNTLVIPGGKMMHAMELILTEQILDIMKRRGHLAAHA